MMISRPPSRESSNSPAREGITRFSRSLGICPTKLALSLSLSPSGRFVHSRARPLTCFKINGMFLPCIHRRVDYPWDRQD